MGDLASVLSLWKPSLLQTALQEAVVVGSPGPGLSPLRGALAVQAHILAPGAREAADGGQARAPSPWALLSIQVLGSQGAVPLGTQWIQRELRWAGVRCGQGSTLSHPTVSSYPGMGNVQGPRTGRNLAEGEGPGKMWKECFVNCYVWSLE